MQKVGQSHFYKATYQVIISEITINKVSHLNMVFDITARITVAKNKYLDPEQTDPKYRDMLVHILDKVHYKSTTISDYEFEITSHDGKIPLTDLIMFDYGKIAGYVSLTKGLVYANRRPCEDCKIESRKLSKGSIVYRNDLIVTGKTGRVVIYMKSQEQLSTTEAIIKRTGRILHSSIQKGKISFDIDDTHNCIVVMDADSELFVQQMCK